MVLEKSNIGFIQTSANILEKIKESYEYKSPFIDWHINKINKLCHEPLNLAVMGEFNAGKSSFINKLLGFDVLPTGIVPKTATIIKVKYGKTPKIEIRYKKDNKIVIEESDDLQKIKAFQKAKDINKDEIGNKIKLIDEIIIYSDNTLLKNFTFIDTPGFNHDEKMDETTRSIYKDIDIVIWLITRNQASKKTEIDELQKLKKHVDNIMLIVNKADVNQEEEDDTQIINNIQKSFSTIISNFDNIHFVSCKKDINAELEIRFQNLLYELKRSALENDVRISEELLKKEFDSFIKYLNNNLQEWEDINQDLSSLLSNSSMKIDISSSIEKIRNVINEEFKNLMFKLNEIDIEYPALNKYSKQYIAEEFFEDVFKIKILNIHNDSIDSFMNKVFTSIDNALDSSQLSALQDKENILLAINMMKSGLIQDAFLSPAILGAIKFYIYSEMLETNTLTKIFKKKVDKKIIDKIILTYQDDIHQATKFILNNQYITSMIENISSISSNQITQINSIYNIVKESNE